MCAPQFLKRGLWLCLRAPQRRAQRGTTDPSDSHTRAHIKSAAREIIYSTEEAEYPEIDSASFILDNVLALLDTLD